MENSAILDLSGISVDSFDVPMGSQPEQITTTISFFVDCSPSTDSCCSSPSCGPGGSGPITLIAGDDC